MCEVPSLDTVWGKRLILLDAHKVIPTETDGEQDEDPGVDNGNFTDQCKAHLEEALLSCDVKLKHYARRPLIWSRPGVSFGSRSRYVNPDFSSRIVWI